MSSHLRNLVPALRQLFDATVVRNWSFAQVTTLTKCQCLSASSYSSDTKDVIDGKATGDLTVNNGGYGKSDERSAGRTRFLGKKIIQNKPVKLHRRKLTKEEVQEDASLDKEIGSLPPEDLFGNLSKGEKSFGTRHDRPIYPRKYVHTETGKQPWQDNRMSEISASQRSKYRNKKRISQESGDSHASKTWGNTFGTLERDLNGREVYDDLQTEESVSSEEEYFSSEEEEERPYRRLTDNGRYSANWYGRQMRDFDRQGKVKEAIDVLDVWMLKNDRVRPNYYVFSMLISILGRAGYTKKAFQVFNQMKKMGVKPKDNTYTALFNACSNSPWHDDGLQRARNLQSLMAEKQHMPNLITYRAMIKAYGVCGDLRAAFALLDEASQRFKPDNRCFSVLLMACCSDKKAGFRHAVLVWRLMKKHGLKPDLYQYNLLLRAVRDCGIGDSNTAAKLIHGGSTAPLRQLHVGSSQLAGENVHRTMSPEDSFVDGIIETDGRMLNKAFIEIAKANKRVEEIPNSHSDTSSKSVQQTGNSLHSNVSKNEQSEIDTENSLSGLSNLSNVTSKLPSILEYPLSAGASSLVTVKLDLLATAEARLALIGGMSGILRNMADDEITPDVKTLSQLVNCIPDNAQAEGELIQILAEKKIQPDVDFFNMLIRKRNLRRDYVGAKELLGVIGEYKLLPNMTTFGCLAMGCRRRADGLQLLRDMQAYGLTPNQAIFTILIYNSSDDFQYKLSLLRQMKALDILPTDKMLMYIEKRLQISKQAILDQERGLEVSNYYRKDNFHRGYKNFLKFYGDWLRSTPVEKGEHPWSKFMHSREKAEPSHSEDEDDESFVRTV